MYLVPCFGGGLTLGETGPEWQILASISRTLRRICAGAGFSVEEPALSVLLIDFFFFNYY